MVYQHDVTKQNKNKLDAHMLNFKRLGLAQITDLKDVSCTFGEEDIPEKSFFMIEAII